MNSSETLNQQPIVTNISAFENICRICLRSGKLQQFKKSSIYTTFINLLYCDTKERTSKNDFSKIPDSFSTQIHHEEDLPQNICKHCVLELEFITIFMAKIRNSTKTLEEISRNFGNKKMEVYPEIKEEPFNSTEREDISSSEETENIILEFESDEEDSPLEKNHEHDTNEVVPAVELHTCHICDKVFTFQTSWKYHMSTHSEVKLWECTSCEWAGLDETLLEVHVKNAHKVDDNESGVDYTQIDQKFLCNICGECFLEKSVLQKHLERHEDEKFHKCEVCGLKFILKTTLMKHLDIHLQEKIFSCNICGKIFTKKCFLDTHIAIFHGPKEKPIDETKKRPSVLCSYCGRTFASEKNLQKHNKTCDGEGSSDMLTCEHCGKKFTFKANLNRHMLIAHSAQKRFSCKVCGEKFTVKNSLKYHMNIHSDSKPYQCTVCSRGFRQPSALIRHKSTVHTSEKKAQCSICFKWLKSDETLKSHMRRHSENF